MVYNVLHKSAHGFAIMCDMTWHEEEAFENGGEAKERGCRTRQDHTYRRCTLHMYNQVSIICTSYRACLYIFKGGLWEKAAPPRPGSQVRSKQPDDFLSAAFPAGSQRHKIHEMPRKTTIDRQ